MRKNKMRTATECGAVCGLFLLLLPLTLPVVLGILAAAVLDPRICRIQQKTGMGRSGAAALSVTGVLAITAALLWLLSRVLLRELSRLSRQLPALLETAAGYGAAISRYLQRFGSGLPGGVGDAFETWAQGLFRSGGTLAENLYDKLFALATGLLTSLPGCLFFLMTMVLSLYFAAAELPRLRDLLQMHLPELHRTRLIRILSGVRTALGGWVRAQIRLMGVTFLLLAAGFFILRIDSPFLLALGIALLDALPVFGTGTVLIPWALMAMMTGDPELGIGLISLYGAAALLRNILEPRLLGSQLGISPLLTLLAIYAGWRIGGFRGVILLPVGTMAAVSLWNGARAQPARDVTPSAPSFPRPFQNIPKND